MIPEHSPEFAKQYHHVHRRMHYPTYKGVLIQKMPNDLWQYHQVLWEKRPEVVVEIGTRYGGATVWFQDNLDMIGEGGKVITIDILDQVKEKDPRITYIWGDSISKEVVEQVRKLTEGKRTMFIIDGKHTRIHVKWEIHHYQDMVTPGQYMVLEDCYVDRGKIGPGEARDWYLSRTSKFKKIDLHKQFLWGITNGGWLLRQ